MREFESLRAESAEVRVRVARLGLIGLTLGRLFAGFQMYLYQPQTAA